MKKKYEYSKSMLDKMRIVGKSYEQCMEMEMTPKERNIFIVVEEVEKLLLCVADLKDIEFQIEQILEELKKLDLKDILKLVEIITRIIGEVQQVFKDIEPCLDSTGEIKKLINKFINLTPIEMLNRIIKHIMYSGKEIYDAIMKIIQGYKDKSYYVIGYNIGEIIELLFFKD